MDIDASGLFTSNGLTVLITQGITGTHIVAGKECLFRTYLPTDRLGSVDRIACTVVRPAPNPAVGIVMTKAYLTTETATPHGPSVGCIVRGFAFPTSGTYRVTITPEDVLGMPLASATFTIAFTATYDLRLVIVPIQGSGRGFVVTPDWYADIDHAMGRVGSIYPVRDCVVKRLDGRHIAGVRYHVAQPKEAWPIPGHEHDDYFEETNAINAAAGPNGDTVDCTIWYRPVQNAIGELPGGNAIYCATPRWASVVAGTIVGGPLNGLQMSAPTFAQEIGHTLCLVPSTSPWFDGGMHSTQGAIPDPLAYDFILHRPYPAPGHELGDVMGWGAWNGADSVHLSEYDWNYLLSNSLPNLGSTGSDTHPALNECRLVLHRDRPVSRPKTPAVWNKIIGNLADGPIWILGPHGPEPGPPGPGAEQAKRARLELRGLQATVRRLGAAGATEVHLPIEHGPITIAEMFLPSLHIGENAEGAMEMRTSRRRPDSRRGSGKKPPRKAPSK